ncbi:sigma-70 family RNA polymerase sigma factor [Adhaeretor mobilis]|uniref:RNA polymerase sigma factor n=1 Tax=Adhaeretor mobilis TaxID=1930276 RepID=A0A517MUL3_9BACT|nr:sigma-70 family RNA polymerase sigma factor [Adhaeretor mobilis]QDS98477.1 RNA polymerase sigma factor [Adhaeretor mobilis]
MDTPRDKDEQYNELVGLLARNDHSIRRFVRSLMPGWDEVDDVLQDTALECWKKFDDFKPQDSESASTEFVRWACVIARYKVLSRQRDYSRDRLVFRESAVNELADAAMSKLGNYEAEKASLEHCLEELSSENRRLIMSVYLPGDSIAKIARENNKKARRLYSKLVALRKSLLQCVQQQMSARDQG